MTFDSLAFLLFLPGVVLLHWAVPSRFRWMVLLGASWFFYAWWDASLLPLILGITGVSYLAGRGIHRASSPMIRRAWLVLTLLSSLGLLIFFKYFDLLGRTAASLLGLFGRGDGPWQPWNIVLPVGISFYTFQAMSYVVDVYRQELPAEDHFGYYALYIAFFPQLVAGPIERAGDLLPQMRAERRFSRADWMAGGRLLISGYFRKLVLADLCAPLVDAVFSAPAPDGGAVMLASMLFAVQIYCDFAGYSEIAAGSARLMGIRLMRNFDKPYGAKDIRDFWRRWHISLSRWFTAYVYIPLGGSRKGLSRQVLATLAVFALSGLWHGAAWNFVAWGLLHGLYMTVALLWRKGAGSQRASALSSGLCRLTTFLCVCFAWIFFRADGLHHAWQLTGALFSPWDISAALGLLSTVAVEAGGLPVLGLTLGAGLLLTRLLPRLTEEGREAVQPGDMTWVLFVLAIALAWIIRLHTGGGNAFIYFRF